MGFHLSPWLIDLKIWAPNLGNICLLCCSGYCALSKQGREITQQYSESVELMIRVETIDEIHEQQQRVSMYVRSSRQGRAKFVPAGRKFPSFSVELA